MKKTTRLLPAVLLTLGLLTAMQVSASDEAAQDKALRFRSDGSFKIMQVTDLQDIGLLSPAAKQLIKTALAREKPDLVVLTGDNIANFIPGLPAFLYRLYAGIAIGQFMRIFQRAGVPVAIVFGNHDSQDSLSREGQMEIYQKYSVFAGKARPEGYTLDGCANYRLPILNADGSEKFQLFFLDSHSDAVQRNQLDWLAAANDRAIPAMVFQHIIVPEIFDYLVPGDNALGYDVPDPSEYNYVRERPCPPSAAQYQGELAVLRTQGNVQALVVGHDHTNNFVVAAGGVDLINTASAGFNPNCNADGDRGVRVFTLRNDGSKYTEKTVRFREICTDPAARLMNRINIGEVSVPRVIATYLFLPLYPALGLIGKLFPCLCAGEML